MGRELAAIVRGNGFQVLAISVQQPYDCLRQWLGSLAVWQLLHHNEAGHTLKQNEDGVPVSIDNEIHLEVSEPRSVCFGGPVVYAGTICDVGGLGGPAFSFRPSFKVRMPAVFAQLSTLIGIYDIVYGLYGNGYSIFSQYSANLFGRPLMVDNHLFYAPNQHVKYPVGGETFSPTHGHCMGFVPQIVAFGRGVAFYLTAKR